ncbi:MAG: HAD-IIIA family hydrolase [Planctomycetes bacterium]|nr:HAD-IIIA family hydrolase [Planctomycetota bacterium]
MNDNRGYQRPMSAPSLPSLRKGAAVFVDRDGTINKQVGYTKDPSQITLLPGAAEAIVRLNARGYLVVMVTNQSAIARGLATEEEVQRVCSEVALQVAQASGGHFDAVYYAPSHPDFPDPRWDVKADWRKPGAGMFRAAAKEFGILLSASWMVGDGAVDHEAAKAAHGGMRTVVLPSEYHDGDIGADYYAETLFEAAQIILDVDAGFCPIEDF